MPVKPISPSDISLPPYLHSKPQLLKTSHCVVSTDTKKAATSSQCTQMYTEPAGVRAVWHWVIDASRAVRHWVCDTSKGVGHLVSDTSKGVGVGAVGLLM